MNSDCVYENRSLTVIVWSSGELWLTCWTAASGKVWIGQEVEGAFLRLSCTLLPLSSAGYTGDDWCGNAHSEAWLFTMHTSNYFSQKHYFRMILHQMNTQYFIIANHNIQIYVHSVCMLHMDALYIANIIHTDADTHEHTDWWINRQTHTRKRIDTCTHMNTKNTRAHRHA